MFRFSLHVDEKDLKIIELLIENGIDVNHQNNIGNTVLHIIADNSDFIDLMCAIQKKIDLVSEIITLLRKLGANVNILNHADQSPIVLAKVHDACAQIQCAFTRPLEGAKNTSHGTLHEFVRNFPMCATSADINAEEL
jgi:ankyrin repeat protein